MAKTEYHVFGGGIWIPEKMLEELCEQYELAGNKSAKSGGEDGISQAWFYFGKKDALADILQLINNHH